MARTRFAGRGDLPRLREIWTIAFGDGEEFINRFYRDHLGETLLLEEEGEAAAMLTLLPMETVTAEGERFSTPCVYAVATHPACRGRGFATILLEDAHRRAKARGEAGLVIVPAGEGLFGFYGQRGFSPAFSLRQRQLDAGELAELPRDRAFRVTPVSPGEYHRRREGFLGGTCHVDCGPEGFRYQEAICRLGRGDLLWLSCGPAEGCAVVERDRERLVVRELLLPAPLLAAGLGAVADAYPAGAVTVRSPLSAGEEGGEPVPFAMARWYDSRLEAAFSRQAPGYLGIAFD